MRRAKQRPGVYSGGNSAVSRLDTRLCFGTHSLVSGDGKARKLVQIELCACILTFFSKVIEAANTKNRRGFEPVKKVRNFVMRFVCYRAF